MAMVDVSEMKLVEKQRVTVHSKARATYSVFEDGGKRYFQIDTYGSTTRDMPEKISQTIQIDRQSAMKLISLLAETFHDAE